MDMHTHILWGVDDGAACLEESLGIIRRLKAMGLKGAYCTPHIMARYPDNTPDFLRRRFDQLLADTREEQFQLRLAAEYMLDNQFNEQLRRYTPLTYDGIHLLVELPQYYLPGAWKDMISSVRDKGYTLSWRTLNAMAASCNRKISSNWPGRKASNIRAMSAP